MKIAIQGERGSFHEEAAKQVFRAKRMEILPFLSFDSTINSVRINNADIGIVAIENSRSGSILYNYSLIREAGLYVIGEHTMGISQNLMALPGQSIHNIYEIWSHPVAISQCMAFLNKYPGISLVETDDTARSAKKISEKKALGVAAIGSVSASEIYGLPIIANSIQTYKTNQTRFLIVGAEKDEIPDANKASVCFSLGHKPGSLASLLVKLADQNINLTRIQSVPKYEKAWEYLFYLDLEFNSEAQKNKLIDLLNANASDLEILGIYKKGDNQQ